MQGFDYQALKNGFNQTAKTYERHAKMARKIGNELISRLKTLNLKPLRILDIGSGTGKLSRELLALYPKARIYCIDIAEERLAVAKGHRKWFRQQHYITADMHALPFKAESFDLVVSNLTWYWADHLNQVIYEAKRVLKNNGTLMFSTLGPDTLRELRASFASISNEPYINTFLDMHDVGDALLKAGFADPVMDVEYMIHYTKQISELFQELKDSGEINYQTLRHRGMLGRKKLEAVINHYAQYRQPQGYPITTEVVFGYAWRKDEGAFHLENGEVAIPISAISHKPSSNKS